LDIPTHSTKDGAEVILYEEKENALVEGEHVWWTYRANCLKVAAARLAQARSR
jgi:hypothetical protein